VRRSGFTLVELMVAITILIIIVLLFGQMLGIMSKAWTFGHGRANNFTKARAMLELLSQDIQDGVFRPDLAAFPVSVPAAGSNPAGGTGATPPTWQFYTGRPGIPPASAAQTSLRNLSIVSYSLIQNASNFSLERSDCAILWGDEGSNPSFGASPAFPTGSAPSGTTLVPTPRDTAPGVIAFRIIFVQSDGSFSTTFTPLTTGGVANATPTRALSVSLAIIDDLTIQQIPFSSGTYNLTYLNSKLNAAVPATPTQSVKAYWDAYLNGSASPSMPWSNFPKSLGGSLATFERYIVLPNAP
jgi:prepilin-type N-terminal cleavage/methylation domain-containing protein